ncbi:TonB-dependent receptor plug domain-containing protein [Altererythrobacter sp. C41]|uniref:TonB-dependent receptor plug domain-containing protein n=1 Tax=Altererythrobacter sp. C41 TaxID=2806021 RepID=UPI00193392DE|nr:TonB-dependent receptor plug domain-containing protein [Altererythrobacter sp. C41]MBM0168478.1 TonB-dependent receptor plug domain-containing protein [Altererythrobacter sp. C41]
MKALIGVAAIALLRAWPACAQDPPESGDAPAPDAQPAASAPRSGQVYTRADFVRYAPKNAYDMLSQVPGFTIRDSEQLRGLGQATGNVLFNGQRPSSKSDTLETQLTRIPADNVERIEILDGATLDIPGLSGQVANIVFKADSFSGQFSWKPEFRAHYTDPLFTRGDVSVSGRSGAIEYEVGLNNDESARSGAGGGTLIYDAAGAVTERRFEIWNTHYDTPKLSGKVTWDGPGTSVGHVNAHYQRIYDRYDEVGERTGPGLPDRFRIFRERNDSWNYELGGDYEFALGPGRLKAIGIRRFSHEPYLQEAITSFADGSADVGDRFTQTGDLGETIARGEYSWKMLGGDWQLSGEAAFNTLENVAGLFTLDPTGEFVEIPFPEGSGGVSEDRYEGLLSFGRKLTPTLSFQLVGGAEHSTIAQTGSNGLTRSFFRPKGSLSLAWTPSDDFDVALKIRRRVLQLSFYDFLARAFLNDGNANSGNNDLRPQQDWSYEAEINKKLGAWGSTQLRLIYRDVEDYVDVIPVDGGESVGNIAKSWAAAVVWTSTINLDPAGLKGVKLDTSVLYQGSRLRDPFTGESRQWSGFTDTEASIALRHDIPGSNWAWGGAADYSHNQPNYRSNQVDRVWEGPSFASLFVENKDVFGLTVRAQVGNILNARSRRHRVVYGGLRGETPITSIEERDRLIGPIFSFSVRGKF